MSSSLKIQLVTTFEEFKLLKADWDSVYDASPRSVVFSSWDWMMTWWEVFQDQFKRELFIVCLYKDEQLVGIAPFQIMTSYPKSLIQGKTLCFIGSGEAYEDSVVSELVDFLVIPEYEETFIESISAYLVENKQKWNFADFNFLPADALILRCFKNQEQKISRVKKQYGVQFYIPDAESFEAYQNTMASRWRKMFVKKDRKLERAGDVTIHETDSKETINKSLKTLADMNCLRWKDRVDFCIFESSRFYEFHQKVLYKLVPQKKAFIKTLRLDDKDLASYYVFEDKDHIHYYQSGFYVEYANRYSPLFLLVCREIGTSIENNKKFDFMFDENPESYKGKQYAADSNKLYRLKWTPQPLRFSAYKLSKQMQEAYLNLKTKIKK